jgi:transcriptional regulator with XRE-family HTH domain
LESIGQGKTKMIKKNLNSALKEAREQHKLSQAELAEKIGVDVTTVSRWERGLTVPQSYAIQKLYLLFGLSAEELGLIRAEDTCPEVEQSPESVSPQLIASSTTVPLLPGAASLFGKARQKSNISIKMLSSVLVCLGLVIMVSMYTLVSSQKSVASSRRPITTPALYHADWSKGADGWLLSQHWSWSNEEGGVIKTTRTVANNVIFVPYSLPTSNYAVEAQIKRIGYSGFGGQAYGLTLRMQADGGYVCGVGRHYLPEHFFMAQVNIVRDNPQYRLSDLAALPAQIDTAWHTYRIEIKMSTMKFFFDGKLVQQLDDTSYLQAGKLGIYVDNAGIVLKSLNVYALS